MSFDKFFKDYPKIATAIVTALFAGVVWFFADFRAEVKELRAEIRDIDRRLTRLETMLEVKMAEVDRRIVKIETELAAK
jgi:hypothetical protein